MGSRRAGLKSLVAVIGVASVVAIAPVGAQATTSGAHSAAHTSKKRCPAGKKRKRVHGHVRCVKKRRKDGSTGRPGATPQPTASGAIPETPPSGAGAPAAASPQAPAPTYQALQVTGGGVVSIGSGRQVGNSIDYPWSDPQYSNGYWWSFRYTDYIDTWGNFWFRDNVWAYHDGRQWQPYGTYRCYDSGGCSWI